MRSKQNKTSTRSKRTMGSVVSVEANQLTVSEGCHDNEIIENLVAQSDQVTDSSHTCRVWEMLIKFQREALFCDTVLMTKDGGRVYAHSALLAAVCPALLSVLNQHPFTQHQPNIIDLSLYEHSLVLDLIQYIYTGRLGCDMKVKDQLIDLLSMLGVAVANLNNDICKDEKANIESVNDAEAKESQNVVVELLKTEETRRQSKRKFQMSSPSFEVKHRKRKAPGIDRINDRESSKRSAKVQKGKESSAITEISKNFVISKIDSFSENSIDKYINEQPQVKEIDNVDVSDSANLQSAKSSQESQSYKCSECDEIFTSRYHLNCHHWTHFLTESGCYQCKMCPKVFENVKSFRQHSKTHLATPSKNYECEICGHSFSHPCRLRSHMSKHTGTLSFICDVCGQRFSRSEYLTVHKRRHSGDMRYSCHICGRRFFNWPAKMAHVRMHTKERPYQCSICGYQFSQGNSLQLHMRVHTGERPYPCSQCSMAFRVASHLKKHVLNKHVDVSERPFACERCVRTFSTNSALKQHMLTHLGLQQRRQRRRTGAATLVSKASQQRQPEQKTSSQLKAGSGQPETFTCLQKSGSGQLVSSCDSICNVTDLMSRSEIDSEIRVVPQIIRELIGGRSDLRRGHIAHEGFIDVNKTIMLRDATLAKNAENVDGILRYD